MADTAGSLLEAMLAVQAEAPTLKKNATNPHFKSKYAPLDTIVETVGPLLVKHKLIWTTQPSYNDAFGPSLKYKLAHAPTEQTEEGEMPLLLSKNDAQGQGSAITYARRYALCAVLNLVAEDDDDGSRAAAGRAGQASPGGDPSLATAPQKKFLRQLVTQNRLDATVMTALMKGVGFELGEGEKVNDAINRLSRDQCSTLIETIKDGAIPEPGGSDVPNDASEFTHPPAGQPEFD